MQAEFEISAKAIRDLRAYQTYLGITLIIVSSNSIKLETGNILSEGEVCHLT